MPGTSFSVDREIEIATGAAIEWAIIDLQVLLNLYPLLGFFQYRQCPQHILSNFTDFSLKVIIVC